MPEVEGHVRRGSSSQVVSQVVLVGLQAGDGLCQTRPKQRVAVCLDPQRGLRREARCMAAASMTAFASRSRIERGPRSAVRRLSRQHLGDTQLRLSGRVSALSDESKGSLFVVRMA
jgi:hypothetical protein